MAFKIKDSVYVGTKNVFDDAGNLLDPNVLGTSTFLEAANQDAVKIEGRAGGTEGYAVTLTPETLSANQTLTLPNKTGTLAVTSDLPNVWGTFAVDGQDSVVADSTSDTVTLIAGSNITITTDATNDTITIAADAGSDLLQNITDDTTTNSSFYVSFVADTSGAQEGKVSSTGLTFNPSTGTLTVGGDLAVNGGDITTSAGTFNIGNTATTAQTLNLATAATADTVTKTLNLGTGGASGSTTNVNIGSATSGALGTVTVNGQSINLGTNSATAVTATVGPAVTGNTLKIAGTTSGTVTVSSDVTTGQVDLFTGVTTGTVNLATGGASTVNVGGAGAGLVVGTTSGNSTLTVNGNGTTGAATITTNVEDGIVNLFADVTGQINLGGASSTVTTGGDLEVTGNLTVNGTTTTVNSTVVTIDDPVFTLGGDTAPTVNDLKDRGIEFRWYDSVADSAKIGFFGFDDSTGSFTFIPDAVNTSEVFTGDAGNLNVGSINKVTITAPANGSTLTIADGKTLTVNNSVTFAANDGSGAVDVDFADGGTVAYTEGSLAQFSATTSAELAGVISDETGTGFVVFSDSPQFTTKIDVQGAVNFQEDVSGTPTTMASAIAKTGSLATTDTTAVDTWAVATYRSAKYLVQITQGSNYQVSEVMVIHNGTNTFMTEYAVLETNGALATLSTAIATGNVELRVTMAAADAATIKIERTALVV